MNLTTKMLLSLGLGIGTGLFFGEGAAVLGVIGDGYVGLLQMTVLPFIAVSLVANIGRFSISEGRSLARAAVAVLVLLWIVALAALAVVPWAYPDLETGSFFSTSLVEEPQQVDFVELYIPSNPFRAMARNMVPAVVLFSILLGVALTTVPRKEILLEQFDVLIAGLVRVNGFVVSLAPFGVFAIAAHAAGTISLNEFGRLQAYLITHTLTVLVLSFVFLPMLIAALTPLRFGAILAASKEFLLTAFITGSLFAVLPMIVDAIDRLMEDAGYDSEGLHATPGVLVPLAYPFPTLGKLLSLLFVPFAAWFVGTPLAAGAYALFLSAGLFSSFGSLMVTIPFLLDLLRIPSDLFQLFLMAGVWSARVSDLAGGMHILAFTVLVMTMLSGRLRVRWGRVVQLAVVTVVLGGLMIGGVRYGIAQTLAEEFSKASVLASMQSLKTDVPATVLTVASVNPTPLEPGEEHLDRIRRRGAVRVGYNPYRLPFSFLSANGDLVGFDIDMAYRLAEAMEVSVEFVPFESSTLAAQLQADHFDLAMSGVRASLALADDVDFSEVYLNVRWAVVVLDDRKDEFATLDLMRRQPDLRWAVQADSFHEEQLRRLFPGTEVVGLEREEEFFEAGDARFDVLVTSAEGGSAWTLIHPSYAVVPVHPPSELPLVYPFARGDQEFENYVNVWIDLKHRNGTVDTLFDYWIRGQPPQGSVRRWSILHDVLHVGE